MGQTPAMSAAVEPFDAIVLAGGTSQRRGTDKTRLLVAGTTALDRVLDAVATARRRVVVGDERPVSQPVVWTREHPPGSGPAAGVAAALPHLRAPVAVLLAADLPYITAQTVRRLLAALPGREAVWLVDAEQRPQHLIAALTATALRQAVARRPSWADAAMHELLGPLDPAAVPARGDEAQDLDLPEPAVAAAKPPRHLSGRAR